MGLVGLGLPSVPLNRKMLPPTSLISLLGLSDALSKQAQGVSGGRISLAADPQLVREVQTSAALWLEMFSEPSDALGLLRTLC